MSHEQTNFNKKLCLSIIFNQKKDECLAQFLTLKTCYLALAWFGPKIKQRLGRDTYNVQDPKDISEFGVCYVSASRKGGLCQRTKLSTEGRLNITHTHMQTAIKHYIIHTASVDSGFLLFQYFTVHMLLSSCHVPHPPQF